MRLRQPGHGAAVVLDADDRPAERRHRVLGELAGPEARAVDDRLGPVLPRQRLLLAAQRADDLALDDRAAGRAGPVEEPAHVHVRVDHRRQVRVGVPQPEPGVDAVLGDQRRDRAGTRGPGPRAPRPSPAAPGPRRSAASCRRSRAGGRRPSPGRRRGPRRSRRRSRPIPSSAPARPGPDGGRRRRAAIPTGPRRRPTSPAGRTGPRPPSPRTRAAAGRGRWSGRRRPPR